MKTILSILILAVLFTGCKDKKTKKEEHNHTQHPKVEEVVTTNKKVLSPHTSVMAMVGDAHVHIDYSSPGVRDRIIFGGLVGYNNVWQAGAHNATWLETSKALLINGEILPAGKYGFFTIPSKGDWTIMINKNWDQHGKDEYDEKDDIIRFNVTPVISDNITEHLEYNIIKSDENRGDISLSWEKVTISFPFELNK